MEAVKLNEKRRIYNFGKVLGRVEIEDVVELIVRESGGHRLKDKKGNLHIVPPGWIQIVIEDESGNWTV